MLKNEFFHVPITPLSPPLLKIDRFRFGGADDRAGTHPYEQRFQDTLQLQPMDPKVRDRVAQLGAAWPAQAAELVDTLEAQAQEKPGPLDDVVAKQMVEAAGAVYAGWRLKARQCDESYMDRDEGGRDALYAAFDTLKRRIEEMKLVVPESLRAVPGPKELEGMILAHAAFKEKPPPGNSVIQLLGAQALLAGDLVKYGSAKTNIPTIEPVLEAYLAKRTSETAGLVAKILADIQAYDEGLVVELAKAGAVEARATIAALLEAHVPQPHLSDGAEAPRMTYKEAAGRADAEDVGRRHGTRWRTSPTCG